MNIYFWFAAGMLAGFAAALVALPLWRGALATLAHRNARIALAAAGVAAFGAVALILYRTLGSPELLGEHVASAPSPHPETGAMSTPKVADSMESAVARREARVARED
jgi:hypothetical protein